MNTDGTKAVVGFAQGQICQLGNVTITPNSRFAAIYVTAPEQDGKVATSRRLLVTALARARNPGMKFRVTGDELLDKGKGPVLMEPVKVTIAIAGRSVTGVRLLDHDGRLTEKTLPVSNGQFTLDGASDQTPYYQGSPRREMNQNTRRRSVRRRASASSSVAPATVPLPGGKPNQGFIHQ